MRATEVALCAGGHPAGRWLQSWVHLAVCSLPLLWLCS